MPSEGVGTVELVNIKMSKCFLKMCLISQNRFCRGWVPPTSPLRSCQYHLLHLWITPENSVFFSLSTIYLKELFKVLWVPLWHTVLRTSRNIEAPWTQKCTKADIFIIKNSSRWKDDYRAEMRREQHGRELYYLFLFLFSFSPSFQRFVSLLPSFLLRLL